MRSIYAIMSYRLSSRLLRAILMLGRRLQLLQEQAASTPDAPLALPGEEALKGILANEKIWCFEHGSRAKDRKEFDYSLTIARRVIEELGGSDDGPTGHFCACLIDLWTTIPSLTRLSSIFSALAAMKTIRSNGRSIGTAVVVSRSGLRPLYSLQPRRIEGRGKRKSACWSRDLWSSRDGKSPSACN